MADIVWDRRMLSGSARHMKFAPIAAEFLENNFGEIKESESFWR